MQVKDPLTFGAHTFPVGNALLSALVTVDDLRELVAGRGLTVETAATQVTTPSSARVVAANTPAKQVNSMKKAALIAELKYEWPSIEADISDATRNGLKTAAHTGKHGEWDKVEARAWAVSKGKIKQAAPVHSLAAAWPGGVTRHTIGDQ